MAANRIIEKRRTAQLNRIEDNQERIIALLEAMGAPVEMVELEPIVIPEELTKKPAKKQKAKVQ